jgi:hypothetical protein
VDVPSEHEREHCSETISPSTHDASIRYVLAFSISVFLQRVLCIFFPTCTYIYIRVFGPQINTSDIHNMVYRAKNSGFLSSYYFFLALRRYRPIILGFFLTKFLRSPVLFVLIFGCHLIYCITLPPPGITALVRHRISAPARTSAAIAACPPLGAVVSPGSGLFHEGELL